MQRSYIGNFYLSSSSSILKVDFVSLNSVHLISVAMGVANKQCLSVCPHVRPSAHGACDALGES